MHQHKELTAGHQTESYFQFLLTRLNQLKTFYVKSDLSIYIGKDLPGNFQACSFSCPGAWCSCDASYAAQGGVIGPRRREGDTSVIIGDYVEENVHAISC